MTHNSNLDHKGANMKKPTTIAIVFLWLVTGPILYGAAAVQPESRDCDNIRDLVRDVVRQSMTGMIGADNGHGGKYGESDLLAATETIAEWTRSGCMQDKAKVSTAQTPEQELNILILQACGPAPAPSKWSKWFPKPDVQCFTNQFGQTNCNENPNESKSWGECAQRVREAYVLRPKGER